MKSKYIRVAIAPTDLTYLICIACGKCRTEYAIGVNGEPQAGVHRACVDMVHQKRGVRDAD